MQSTHIGSSIYHLGEMSSTMFLMISAFSLVMISLIMILWIKNRSHEAGILISLGKSKGHILLQFLIEMVMIFMLSFALICLFAKPASQLVATTLAEQNIEKLKADERKELEKYGV